ncbi:FAS1-like dehydratase domain-containing protein [Dactylosporangium sp. CA-233914]|uniref:FAS1-like dehydratase domain-containing protein n=1 Tax=Dactylosporangium sp. CA-233914 TaxID=3239934 RepID=UPI003D92A33E
MHASHFPVEWGHVMTFARAVGDEHEMYRLDGLRDASSVTAPPTFVAAYVHFDEDWPLRPRPGRPWLGSGRNPSGVTAEDDDAKNLLHAEQRFEYHAPVRPGDVLTVTESPGETWTKVGRRGGLLAFTQKVQEFRNQHGQLVVTATSTGVVTERTAS